MACSTTGKVRWLIGVCVCVEFKLDLFSKFKRKRNSIHFDHQNDFLIFFGTELQLTFWVDLFLTRYAFAVVRCDT